MTPPVSKRLLDIVDALPLREGMRILEIGCGTGIAAREIAYRFDHIHIMGIDRSAKAIAQAQKNCEEAISAGKINFIQAAIETLTLQTAVEPFNLAFAIRVGALDGRHPGKEAAALKNIAKLLQPGGKLYIDGGAPLEEVNIDGYR